MTWQPSPGSRPDARIRVGFQRNTPPFSYCTGAAFEPIGYSADLARLIFGAVDVVEVTSSTREELLLGGLIDIECGSTTITAHRLARHAFSRPIFRTSQRIAVKGARRPGPLRVTCISGSTSQRALESESDPGFSFTFSGVPSIGEARDAFLYDKDVDAIVADEIILRSLLAAEVPAEGAELLDSRLGEEFYGFMIRREDEELIAAVDAALERILASAEYADICRRWFTGSLSENVVPW